MNSTSSNVIPKAGYGVYALTPADTQKGVSLALEAGYRHIDTAQSYHNEKDCGRVIEQSGLLRPDVFVTTKITPRNFATGMMTASVQRSLEDLRLDQIDLVLIHYPYPWDQIPMEVYLTQLAEVHEAGLAKMIGVSNFNIRQIEFAQEFLGDIEIATNQVEIHVFMQNRPIVDYCRSVGIQMTAYCALARGNLFGVPEADLGPHPVLMEIANDHDATIAQVGLAFLYHEGHVALATTTEKDQIKSNYDAINLSLSDADMDRLRGLDMNKRIVETPYFPIFD